MNVLWLSNKVLSSGDEGKTGTWLSALADRLSTYGGVRLGNISFGDTADVVRRDYGPIRQWIVPARFINGRGLPPERYVSAIRRAADVFSPDLVQVWGTEAFWGLLTARRLLPYPALLEIQGLKVTISRVFSGDLGAAEQRACTGPREIIRGESFPRMRERYARWGTVEEEIIAGHRFISVMIPWVRAQVRAINASCRTFPCDRILRSSFYDAEPWRPHSGHVIFSSAAYSLPFKGLHVAVRAAAILKKTFPDVELRIAGDHQSAGFRSKGYIRWINGEIDRLGLRRNIVWLGALPAERIIRELRNCNAALMPSFVESYCLALSEAMILGVPPVVSFAGGMTDLAEHGNSALFFPPGDAAACAHQIERLFTTPELTRRISEAARESARVRYDQTRILSDQLAIYRRVLENEGMHDVAEEYDGVNAVQMRE